MSDRNSGFENLEDSVLLDMVLSKVPDNIRAKVTEDKSYEDALLDKIALERTLKSMDTTSGAPANVRYSVSAAQSPDDKLATLRVFYPDAIRIEDLDPESGADRYGHGNFVYRNPETNQLTLYDEFNPKFLGIPIPTGRDFIDFGPELAETAGAIGGFIGGGIGGTYAAPYTGGYVNPITGAIIGEGVGSASARELYIGIADVFGETIDTRGLGDRTLDFTQTATFNAAAGPIISKTWQGLKYVAGQPIRWMTGTGNEAARATKEAFDTVGLTNPTAGQISNNEALNMLEGSLAAMPTSTKVMHESAKRTIDEIDIFARDLAERYGGVRTMDEAGLELMDGLRASRLRYNNKVNEMYSQIDSLMPPTLSSDALHVQEFVKKYATESKTVLGKERLNSVMELAKKVLKDAEAGVLNYNNLKNFRSALRENISSATSAGARPDAQTVKLKELYGYVTKDLDALVAASPNPKANSLYRKANEFVADATSGVGGISFVDEVLNKGKVSANKALKHVLSGAKDGGSDLLRLKNELTAEEFNVISGYMLGQMGLPTAAAADVVTLGAEGVFKEGAEYIAEQGFSPRRFMTKWNQLSKEAKDVLFKGTEFEDLIPELNALVNTVESVGRAAEAMANPSGTAKTFGTIALLSTAGGTTVGAGFDFGFSALLAPYMSAKLMTNKSFVRWLTEGVEIAAYNPNSFGQHVRRLYQIYEVNPEIRDEVRAIIDGMQLETIEQIEDRNADNVPPVTTAVENEQAFREVTNPEVAGKVLPDVRLNESLGEQIASFKVPEVSPNTSLSLSPTVLPNEKDREIAMREAGIGAFPV